MHMTDAPKAVAAEEDRFSGFSSDELLRRARVLRQVAEREHPRERHRLNRLALDLEDAARQRRAGEGK
jgi:hypothetical protein